MGKFNKHGVSIHNFTVSKYSQALKCMHCYDVEPAGGAWMKIDDISAERLREYYQDLKVEQVAPNSELFRFCICVVLSYIKYKYILVLGLFIRLYISDTKAELVLSSPLEVN